ncbi:hypothetical protein VTJ83DRAFT_4179 [Remersonia thermophila]|uniref:F-box domain-containing protein n=1 Tax=Remersonia thermophila TaxID=72144 RepID=A0ABR4D956_9PEZI
MDSLPFELVRLIFDYCDAASVRTLRLTGTRYAEVGYEFLLPGHFDAVEWRDDARRLRSIAGHDRLRREIRSVTFNFARINEHEARHDISFQHWLHEPEERRRLIQDAWCRYHEREKRARRLAPVHSRVGDLEEAFRNLPSLRHLDVTFARCPYPDLPVLGDVFGVPSCRALDRALACKNLNAVVSAARHARPGLDSFSVDQLPLELFRLPDDRRLWFDCARASFANLSRLRFVLDVPASMLPSARFRAVNGLGHVLQQAAHLTHLSLAFHMHHAPAEKFPLSLQGMFGGGGSGASSPTRAATPTTSPRAGAVGDPVFARLTDLHLEGVSLAERDLRGFLLRHAATLERLRLGGRGLARPHEPPLGGVHLHEGSFRGLFSALQGRLPALRRFHMEGDAEAGDFRAPSAASHREVYMFRPVADDEWRPVGGDETWVEKTGEQGSGGVAVDGKTLQLLRGRGGGGGGGGNNGGEAGNGGGGGCVVKVVDSRALERFLIEGVGEYPRLGKVGA